MKKIYSLDPEPGDPEDTAFDVLAWPDGRVQLSISAPGEYSFNDNEVSKMLCPREVWNLWSVLGKEVATWK